MALSQRASMLRHIHTVVASSSSSSSRQTLVQSDKLQFINNRRPIQRALLQQQTRTKRTASSSAAKNNKKAAISRAIESNKSKSNSTTTATSSSSTSTSNAPAQGEALFGLHPPDYSIPPPIRFSPPPPPTKPGLQKYLWPATLLFTAGTVAYFYVNNKNDNYAYWEAMQSGEALKLDDDDEYDDDEDYEEDEEDGGGIESLETSNNTGKVAVENVESSSQKKRGWFGWLRRGKKNNDGTNDINLVDKRDSSDR